VRHALLRVIESLQTALDHTKSGYIGVLGRSLKECLESDADSHERLSRLDVFPHGLDIACVGELCKAVAKVTNSGQDEFLQGLSAISNMSTELCVSPYVCLFYIFGRSNPFDFPAQFLDGIDK
jgi:hypothetical protein